MRGSLEGFFDFFSLPVGCFGSDIPRGFRPHLRRARLDRGARVDHAGQVLVVRLDELRGIDRLLARRRHDRGDCLAREIDPALGERRARRRGHRRAVGALEERRKGDMADLVRAQVGHRPGCQHARCLPAFIQINGGNLRVRMRRADDDQPGEVRELEIGAIAPLADEEPVVLQALLRARGAEARRGWIELDLQLRSFGRVHLGKEKVAEREGFEPPVPDGYNRFRVCRIRPLCHLSAVERATDSIRVGRSSPVRPGRAAARRVW